MDYFKEDLKKKRSQKIVACLVAPARNSVVCFHCHSIRTFWTMTFLPSENAQKKNKQDILT